MSVGEPPPSPTIPLVIMIQSIIANGVDATKAAAARQYLDTITEPLVKEVTRTLVEAFATQVVFYVLVVLIILMACVVVSAHMIGIPSRDTVVIVIALLVIGIVFLVIITYYALAAAREAANDIVKGVQSTITAASLTAAIESGAAAYMKAIGAPC